MQTPKHRKRSGDSSQDENNPISPSDRHSEKTHRTVEGMEIQATSDQTMSPLVNEGESQNLAQAPTTRKMEGAQDLFTAFDTALDRKAQLQADSRNLVVLKPTSHQESVRLPLSKKQLRNQKTKDKKLRKEQGEIESLDSWSASTSHSALQKKQPNPNDDDTEPPATPVESAIVPAVIEATPNQNLISADKSNHLTFDGTTKGGAGVPDKTPPVNPLLAASDLANTSLLVGGTPVTTELSGETNTELAVLQGTPPTKAQIKIDIARIDAMVDASDDPKQTLPFPRGMQVTRMWNGVMTTKAQILKLKPLSAIELCKHLAYPALKTVIRIWKEAPVFPQDLKAADPNQWDACLVRELVANAFAGGDANKHYYTGEGRQQEGARHKAKMLLLNLAVTPRHLCPGWNPTLLSLVAANFLEKLLYFSQMFFGPVAHLWTKAQAEKEASTDTHQAAPAPAPANIFLPKNATMAGPMNPQEDSSTAKSPTPTASATAPKVEPPRTDPTTKTFFDISTPGHSPLSEDTREAWKQRDEITSTQIRAFLAKLHTVDPEARLCRFPAEMNVFPGMDWIHHLSFQGFFPVTKKKSNVYFHNQWVKNNGERSSAKALLWHTKTIDELLEAFTSTTNYSDCWNDDGGDDQSFFLTESILQDANTVPIAWLCGTTWKTNLTNLGHAIHQTPNFSTNPHINIELSMKFIQQFPGEKVDSENRIFAVHVYTSRAHAHQVLQWLARLYSESKKYGYPESKKLYLVPDLSSPANNVTPDDFEEQVYTKYIAAQAAHLKTVRVISLSKVITNASTNLSAAYPHNLHAAVMGMFDKKNSSLPCFISLDQDKDVPGIWHLTVREPQYPNSCRVAKVLGIMCCQMWGDGVFDVWFTPSHRQDLAVQYKYKEDARAWVASGDRIFRSLATTAIMQQEYTVDTTAIPPAKCVIGNLELLMEGAFRTRSTIPSVLGNGVSVASTIRDKPGQLTVSPTVEPMDFDFDADSWDEDDDAEMSSPMDKLAAFAAGISIDLDAHKADDSTGSTGGHKTSFVISTDEAWGDEILYTEANTTGVYPTTVADFEARISNWYRHRQQQGDTSEYNEAFQTNAILGVLMDIFSPTIFDALDEMFALFHSLDFAGVIWKSSLTANVRTEQPTDPPRSIRIPYCKLYYTPDLEAAIKDTWMYTDPRVLSTPLLLDYIIYEARTVNKSPMAMMKNFDEWEFILLLARQQYRREELQKDYEDDAVRHLTPKEDTSMDDSRQIPSLDDGENTSMSSQQPKQERFAPEANAEPGGGVG